MMSPPTPRIHLRGLTAAGISEAWNDVDIAPRIAHRIAYHTVGRYSDDLCHIPGLSKRNRLALESRCRLTRLDVVERCASRLDPFVKYLFESPDDRARFEAVRIPLEKPRYCVCVSTQVGCPMSCRFCETGRLGFLRNLSAWEMVDQLLRVRHEAHDRPVTGVVFQGQGEPFLNLDNVLQAAAILRAPSGARIGADRITISTVGIPSLIERYTDEGHPYRLIVSLSSAFESRRAELIPATRCHGLSDIIESLRRHARARRVPVHLAWVLIAGWNTGEDEAIELARSFSGVPLRLSLIDVSDPTGQHRPPDDTERKRFLDALSCRGIAFVRRYSGGADIGAACGRLASKCCGAAGS